MTVNRFGERLDRYAQAARGLLSIPLAPRSWGAFTAAAGAALAMGQTADAQIMNNTGPVPVGVFRGPGNFGTTIQQFDLDGNATPDLNFGVRWSSTLGGPPNFPFLNFGSAFMAAELGNAALHTAGGQVANLASGAQIGPAANFLPNGPGGFLRTNFTSSNGVSPPVFLNDGNFDGTGLVGFRFQRAGNDHFGWLRFDVQSDAAGLTLLGYAWELTPGAAIEAGAVPEPSSLALGGLALLAMGSVGVRKLREKRRAAQADALLAPPVAESAN